MQDKISLLNGYLKERGLKVTRQRDLIVHEFFRRHQHLTVEELLERVRKLDAGIGYATVYRTLRLLTECGLASKREFGGSARFEHVTDHHHDHMICVKCGKITEFENDRIEKLQEDVCRRYKFTMINHKMELYGYCERCRPRKAAENHG